MARVGSVRLESRATREPYGRGDEQYDRHMQWAEERDWAEDRDNGGHGDGYKKKPRTAHVYCFMLRAKSSA